MDVRHMRQVLAIHRHGSFARAAEELGVAQPTLSKSILRLEDQLGVRLFERSGSGAQVTPMGELIVSRAARIVADAERLSRDVAQSSRGEMGEVRLGFGPAARSMIIPELTVTLAARYPDLRLRLGLDGRARLLGDLQSGELDIVISGRGVDMETPDLVVTDLLEEPVIAVAAPSHPLARSARVSMEDLARYPTASGGLPSLLAGRYPEHGAMLLRAAPQVTCNDDMTLKLLAANGLTTMLANEHLVRAEIESGVLVRLPLELEVPMTICAAMTRPSSHSPILRRIVEVAEEVCLRLGLSKRAAAPAPRRDRLAR